MVWCHQATSHYLNQSWSRSVMPYGMTRPQLVDDYVTNISRGKEKMKVILKSLLCCCTDTNWINENYSWENMIIWQSAIWNTGEWMMRWHRCLMVTIGSSCAQALDRLVPLPAAIPSSDETGRYAWISRSAGFCRTGSGWPAGRTLQWARPQPTEPHVVRHTYNLRRHETVDLILNSRYLGHARLMITLPTELWSNNLENKLGYNRDFLHYIII